MPEPQQIGGNWVWQPTESDLSEVVALLQHSQSQDNNIQVEVQRRLDSLNCQPEFYCYLSYVLGELKHTEVGQRALSGLLLKNSIRTHWTRIPPSIRNYLKQHCFTAIGEESPLIRATVGIIITTIFSHEKCSGWPELLVTLLDMLNSDNERRVEGALSSLQKICEDSAEHLVFDEVGVIVTKILPFFQSRHRELRVVAVSTINAILLVQNEAFAPIIDVFLAQLFPLVHDQSEEIQRELCRSLTLLLENFAVKISSQLGSIAQFIMTKNQDPNLETALEACEFWLALAENPDICKQVVTPIMPELVSILLKCMRYSPIDLANLRADIEDNSTVPDRAEDIRPRTHRARNPMESGGDDGDSEDEDDGGDTEWSLRKCAAASLDMLSGIFQDAFLEPLLPLVHQCLQSQDWLVLESGILALGAVSEGCSSGMSPHLAELIPYLLSLLDNQHALVRSITCWTLSRYCHFVVYQPQSEIFKVLLDQLLVRILDRNKRVQEAACSAFATFEEEAGNELAPFLPNIIRTLVEACNRYQAKNLLILYDAIGTLADSVREKLSENGYSDLLMQPLLQKAQQLPDDDRELFPLLESISSIANATGLSFRRYCELVFQRCIRLINSTLQQVILEQSSEANNPLLNGASHVMDADKDFLIVALDLISELAEGVRSEMMPIVSRSNLVELTLICAQDTTKEVRQSSFALLGDLVKTCYAPVSTQIPNFMPLLIGNLDPQNVSVCNNAIWALGEIALKINEQMRQYVPAILPSLISVMNQERITKTLIENTAITLGRLGLFCASMIAPHLQLFIKPWCLALRNIRDNDEKETAFRGVCYMINENPQGVISNFVFFCDAMASWQHPPTDLGNMFRAILVGFQAQIGNEVWTQFVTQLPVSLRSRLQNLYNI